MRLADPEGGRRADAVQVDGHVRELDHAVLLLHDRGVTQPYVRVLRGVVGPVFLDDHERDLRVIRRDGLRGIDEINVYPAVHGRDVLYRQHVPRVSQLPYDRRVHVAYTHPDGYVAAIPRTAECLDRIPVLVIEAGERQSRPYGLRARVPVRYAPHRAIDGGRDILDLAITPGIILPPFK